MKLLKKASIIALAAAGVFAFSGCGAAKSIAATSSNWYVRTGHTGIQPTSVEGEEGFGKEILTYGVSFVENSNTNSTYRAYYDPSKCSYRTEFYATSFDWNAQTLEKYKADKKETVYVLKTELKMAGYYTLLNTTDGAVHFSDSIVTESYFRSAGDNLTPVYSFQEVNSTSPKGPTANNADEMAEQYAYTYAVYYNADATEATVLYTDVKAGAQPEESTSDLSKAAYSLFDNAYLLFAIRAMGINEVGYSKNILSFIPADGGVCEYSVQTLAKQALPEECAGIKGALVGAGYATDSEEIKYNSVSLAYAASLTGGTKTIWYAAINDSSANACRSTMLKLSVPLSYGLGTLEYSLQSVDGVLGSAK